MFERKIYKDDIRYILKNGEVIEEYLDDKPFPSFLLLGFILNRPIHIIVAFNKCDNNCIIITAYEPNVNLWQNNFKSRIKK